MPDFDPTPDDTHDPDPNAPDHTLAPAPEHPHALHPDHAYYLLIRASITSDYITARRARELYAEAAAQPETDLYGDLKTGFYFWSFDPESGLKLVHCRVTPVPADEVPADIRHLLPPPPPSIPPQ